MWYRFNPFHFAEQMLPPLLRKPVLLAILRAMLRPLNSLLDCFATMREQVRIRINTTGQTFSLEGALNEKYHLPRGTIFLTDTEDKRLYLYFQREGRGPWHLRKAGEVDEMTYLYFANEGKHGPDFIVHVPSFLRTEEAEINRFITRYKPAGRTYKIEYYDYE